MQAFFVQKLENIFLQPWHLEIYTDVIHNLNLFVYCNRLFPLSFDHPC